MINFKPLQDRVLIKKIEQESKTKSGIIIPDNIKEKPMQGIVIEIGTGLKNNNNDIKTTEIKKGDKVLFAKWSGTEIKLDNQENLIMKESGIMGIII